MPFSVFNEHVHVSKTKQTRALQRFIRKFRESMAPAMVRISACVIFEASSQTQQSTKATCTDRRLSIKNGRGQEEGAINIIPIVNKEAKTIITTDYKRVKKKNNPDAKHE